MALTRNPRYNYPNSILQTTSMVSSALFGNYILDSRPARRRSFTLRLYLCRNSHPMASLKSPAIASRCLSHSWIKTSECPSTIISRLLDTWRCRGIIRVVLYGTSHCVRRPAMTSSTSFSVGHAQGRNGLGFSFISPTVNGAPASTTQCSGPSETPSPFRRRAVRRMPQ